MPTTKEQFTKKIEELQGQIYDELIAHKQLEVDFTRSLTPILRERWQHKLEGERILTQTEAVRTSQKRALLQVEQVRLEGTQIKIQIEQEKTGIIRDELGHMKTERALINQARTIQLDGKSQSLPLLRESVEIALGRLRAKNAIERQELFGGGE